MIILSRKPTLTVYRRGWFGFDDGVPRRGYTNGRTWNGWACPGLEWEDAATAVDIDFATTKEAGENCGGSWYRIDRNANAIVEIDEEGTEHRDEGTLVETVDGPRRLYFPGSGSYCWNDETVRQCGHVRDSEYPECAECGE